MTLPPASLAQALPRIDSLDVYAVPVDPADDVDAVCDRVFGQPPRLDRLLMRLRDLVVRPLGLKTTPPGRCWRGASGGVRAAPAAR